MYILIWVNIFIFILFHLPPNYHIISISIRFFGFGRNFSHLPTLCMLLGGCSNTLHGGIGYSAVEDCHLAINLLSALPGRQTCSGNSGTALQFRPKLKPIAIISAQKLNHKKTAIFCQRTYQQTSLRHLLRHETLKALVHPFRLNYSITNLLGRTSSARTKLTASCQKVHLIEAEAKRSLANSRFRKTRLRSNPTTLSFIRAETSREERRLRMSRRRKRRTHRRGGKRRESKRLLVSRLWRDLGDLLRLLIYERCALPRVRLSKNAERIVESNRKMIPVSLDPSGDQIEHEK